MILGKSAILERLGKDEIFRHGTWSEDCVREASYDLRVAADGMVVNGAIYPPGKDCPDPLITIQPGYIAILSTIEEFNMPRDILGHQGIKFNFAVRGLTGLMGILVDPLYGSNQPNERLFIRVANLGNQDVHIQPRERVFNIEFEAVDGGPKEATTRGPMWPRVLEQATRQPHGEWTYATKVRADLAQDVERVRQGPEAVAMFGVFLVAATLLGVAISILLSLRDTPTASVPGWVTQWGWVLILLVISVAALATAAIGWAAVTRFRSGTTTEHQGAYRKTQRTE